jgi:hypothetical protein
MLARRDAAARWALFEAAARLGLWPLDQVLGWFEQRWLPQMAAPIRRHPLLLVIGPPRSGSTLASQILAAHLKVSYLPNLCNVLPSAPFTASRLLRRRLAQGVDSDFRSFYGNTSGWAGMSDGFCLWNRWLGNDRYRAAPQLTVTQQHEMKTFFDCWTTYFDLPFLNKNNRNVDAVSQLSEALPSAYFVVITRDPFYIAQSLLNAREFIQGDTQRGWGLYSADTSPAGSPYADLESVCQQILRVQHRIDSQLACLDAHRYLRIDYEHMCLNPVTFIEKLCDAVPGVTVRDPKKLSAIPPFRVSNRNNLRPEEAELVQRLLSSRATLLRH